MAKCVRIPMIKMTNIKNRSKGFGHSVFGIYLLLFFSGGCANVHIPDYISDENPYRRIFYADFSSTLAATAQSLESLGWPISKTAEPSIFERSRLTEEGNRQQTLLFTEIRQTPLFLGTRYARVNAYLRAVTDHTTEVELRYLTVTSVPLKSFYNYRKDHFIKRVFQEIERRLSQ